MKVGDRVIVENYQLEESTTPKNFQFNGYKGVVVDVDKLFIEVKMDDKSIHGHCGFPYEGVALFKPEELKLL